jgi:uncharacterized protein YecE (DUF72 family)
VRGARRRVVAKRGSVHVGTSGWVYKHWRGTFYPEDLPQKEWFAYYAERFDTVEVNNTFYRLPSEDAVASWREAAPPGFRYAFKGSRYVTHRKKLLPSDKYPHGERDLVDRVRGVGAERLACVLWQLPPGWHVDVERLRAFLQRLPTREDVRYAFEFRDETWYGDEVLSLLGEHGVAFCIHDWPDAPTPIEVTADLVYVRFHGHTKPYADEYTGRRLHPWVDRIRAWQRQGRDVLAYFNNDQAGYATRDARWLAEKLGVAKEAEVATPSEHDAREGSPRRAAMP